ncbi:hypothetical protein niasHS_008524 [Heterodera schachtii]|uniref:Uncharacterized protein n=1 Tax=Heterodera schachtii TaxID=97005 RepID=A0ABD2J743_HETSC
MLFAPLICFANIVEEDRKQRKSGDSGAGGAALASAQWQAKARTKLSTAFTRLSDLYCDLLTNRCFGCPLTVLVNNPVDIRRSGPLARLNAMLDELERLRQCKVFAHGTVSVVALPQAFPSIPRVFAKHQKANQRARAGNAGGQVSLLVTFHNTTDWQSRIELMKKWHIRFECHRLGSHTLRRFDVHWDERRFYGAHGLCGDSGGGCSKMLLSSAADNGHQTTAENGREGMRRGKGVEKNNNKADWNRSDSAIC